MKLRLKILIYIIFFIAVIFSLVVGLVNYRYNEMMVNMAQKTADIYTEQNAIAIQSILNKDAEAMRTLTGVLENIIEMPSDIRHKTIIRILTSALKENEHFLATWLSVELAAIDNKWIYDYGRIRYMVYWQDGVIKFRVDSLDLEGDKYNSIYYKQKVSGNKTFITNPYLYSYSLDTASTFLETSIGANMYRDDKFIGMAGVDIKLDRFQSILKKIKPFENSQVLIVANDGTIVAHSNRKYIRKNLRNIMQELFNFDIIKKIKLGKAFSAMYQKDKKTFYVSFYPIYIADGNTPWSVGFIVPYDIILKDIRINTRESIMLSILGLIIISFLIWLNFTAIIKPVEKTTKTLEKLSIGEIDSNLKLSVNRQDELGKMALAVNRLINALEKTVEFAIKIGKGQLDATYNLLGPYDRFGAALLEMKNNLIKSREEHLLQQKQSEKLSWTQTGLSEINEILRLKSDNLEQLSFYVLKFLVDYLNANQGGFYVIDFKQKNIIKMTAAYAYDRRKQLTAEFELGEGLIGRAVKEKNIIHLSEVPQGYTFITSGLGGATPNNLIILPFVFEDEVYGAVEILSFETYEEYQVEFLKQAAERIASTISIMQKNIETQELLKQLQLQTATFEMKERQFAKFNNRLKQLQKDIELRMVEIEMITEAFSLLASVIEIDKERKIRSINDMLPNVLKVEREELIGKDIYQIIENLYGDKWNKLFWNDIFNGITRQKQTKYVYNGKTVSFNEVYIPIMDKNKEILKILIIGIRS